jgi:uncharacterized membrane protein YbhN (UPF0104 family)
MALALDRSIGAGSALALAFLCLPFVAVRYSIEVPMRAIAAGIAICVALGAGLMLWRKFRNLTAQFWQMTRGMRTWIVAVFALSMAMHALFAGGIQLAIQALGLPMSFVETVFATAGGMLLVAIPVSLAGLGLAEAGATGIYIALGHAPPLAAIAGALPYLARLVAALEGGIWEVADGGVVAFAAMQQILAKKPAKRI